MTLASILTAIDQEISNLQRARTMLATEVSAPAKKSVGRPKGTSKVTVKSAATTKPATKDKPATKLKPVATAKPAARRAMSEEGRARIAAAQKKRWAKAKKSK